MKKEKTTLVPALDKGLKILEVLSQSQDYLTMSQIAMAMEYKVSEIQRMVEYLNQNRYINKNNQGGFYLSRRFFSLTSRMDFHRILANRAIPIMNRFAMKSEESIQLSVLIDRELQLLVHTDSTKELRLSIKPGMFNPMDSISGQMLISYLPELEKEKFNLKKQDLIDLEEIRKTCEVQGYWTGQCSSFQGIYRITTPVNLSEKGEFAALTCSFLLPIGQKLDEYRKNLIDVFLETRRLIEEAL
ncbi:MAG: hypothetical protein PF518_18705 [Spirochaetaceae bacterium]|jgi:DNA-binding IclR family transcriptional regulator|nr:hypothetical protein [Spirochaetaceae bacterium]